LVNAISVPNLHLNFATNFPDEKQKPCHRNYKISFLTGGYEGQMKKRFHAEQALFSPS
jgi:hypothetical protein